MVNIYLVLWAITVSMGKISRAIALENFTHLDCNNPTTAQVGPHPWMHYKYADQYRPYNIEEEFHSISSSSRETDKHSDKRKSSAHSIRKEAKTEAKHDKTHKHTTWVKTKEVAEHVKDGIAKLTLGSVASCVKPGKDDSTDVVDGGKITSIKEIDVPEDNQSDLHGVFDASTKTWDDIKAKVDSTLKKSKEFPGVDLDENEPCHSGFVRHIDEKRKKSVNVDVPDSTHSGFVRHLDEKRKNSFDEVTHWGFARHRLGKKKKSKSIDSPDDIESDLHGVFDASTKTWDDIKAKVDSAIKKGKEFTGADLDENKPCHSGFVRHIDEKRKKSINEDVPENTHSGFLRHRNDKRKKSIEKAKVDQELKNIAHCILGSFDDEVDKKWDDIKARTDAILENSKKVPDKGVENAADLGENGIQQEKDPTISLSEKEIDSVNRDLATIWKVDGKFEITEEDIVGAAPENLNFVIKGGVKTIHASMPDVFEVRREAIAATSWNTTVHLPEEVDDDPMDAYVMDEDVCSGARLNRDLDTIVADLRFI